MLEHRSLSKLKGTYVDALPALVDPADGRIHTNFKMTVTANAPMGAGQPAMPIQSVIFFKNYDFSVPDAAQFAIPADYVQAASMQAVMMEGMDLGALMQQMQQTPPAGK